MMSVYKSVGETLTYMHKNKRQQETTSEAAQGSGEPQGLHSVFGPAHSSNAYARVSCFNAAGTRTL